MFIIKLIKIYNLWDKFLIYILKLFMIYIKRLKLIILLLCILNMLYKGFGNKC